LKNSKIEISSSRIGIVQAMRAAKELKRGTVQVGYGNFQNQ
jgi:hypothetical protein